MNRLVCILVIFLLTTTINAKDLLFSPINVSHGLSDNQIRYILQLPDGRMVFTTSGNLNLYDGSGFKYIHRTEDNLYPLTRYNGHYRIYQSEDTLLWIKDAYKLMCVDLKQEKYISDLDNYFNDRGIKDKVQDVFVDTKQQLWLITANGLLQYSTSELFDLSSNPGELQDLATYDNKLFLFYSTGSIICYDIKTKKILFNKAAYPTNEETKFRNTSLVVIGQNGFYQLRNGHKGGFFFFDIKKFEWTKLLETDYILNTLFVTQDNIAYISCKSGIWIIDSNTGDKEYLPELKTINGSSISTEISTLFIDKQGGLWMGTFNQGLLYSHPSRYKFKQIGSTYFPKSQSGDFIVQAFAEDSFGNVYIKTKFQYFKILSSGTGRKTLLAIKESALPQKVIKKLNLNTTFVNNGVLYTDSLFDTRAWKWLGTRDGLILQKPEKPMKHILYTEDGLSNNSIHAILEDHNKNLWVTTSYGISKILIDSISQELQFSNFNPLDGTLTGEYADGAIFEASDGALYFGGVNGFNILESDDTQYFQLYFKPVLSKLFLKGEKVMVGKKYDNRTILSQATQYTKELNLSYDQNFIKLEFSALNFLNPHQTRYCYQLKGIDRDWVETFWGSENFGDEGNLRISYTNLPPGKYILKVKAIGINKISITETSELRIIIHPPWWETNTAYALYSFFSILLVSLSLYFYIHFTRKKLVRKNREELLLDRIRNLIEQQKQFESEKETELIESEISENNISDIGKPASTNSEFISKAISLVEKNINVPGYSVEQLSLDLCMDRTGLYRKLKTELDKSPSVFIRNVRLQRAAQLILEEKLNISEIAEKVGFSSSSYLSKCFQDLYGCRPSEYAEKKKKST